MDENEKAELGAKTFQNFCEQFGKDVHAHILLEELLEGLINAETLFIFGEQEKAGDQANNSASGDGSDELGDHRSIEVQPASGLGETNYPAYP